MSFDKHVIAALIPQSYQWDFHILKPQWIALKIFLYSDRKPHHKGCITCREKKKECKRVA
jgi:hypothetical protein